MTAELSATPKAAADAVRAKIKQDQDLAEARGIKKGRGLERAEMLAAMGAKTMEDVSLLGAVQQAHAHTLLDMRAQFEREERKHGAYRFWKGSALGLLIGACIGTAATFVVIDQGQKAAFDAATEATARGVIVDRASKAAEGPHATP